MGGEPAPALSAGWMAVTWTWQKILITALLGAVKELEKELPTSPIPVKPKLRVIPGGKTSTRLPDIVGPPNG